MASEVFHKALHYTFENEGGFSNIKEDVGGPTKFGITIAVLSHWRHKQCEPDDVRGMELREAEAIYKAWYWEPIDLDLIENDKVAMALFDRAVKDGLTGCTQRVKRVLGHDSGEAGWERHDFPELIATINKCNPVNFVMSLADICDLLIQRTVDKHPTQRRFYNGWKNRVNRMRRELGSGTEVPFEHLH